jgi:hypothetical protein
VLSHTHTGGGSSSSVNVNFVMSLQDSHQVIVRWCVATPDYRVPYTGPLTSHTDANEVIVTGTFDQASLPIASFLFFIPLMPRIDTGISLRLPSILFSSSPYLCLHQAGLFTSPASPIALKRSLSSSHRETRWHTSYRRWSLDDNDVEPTEVDPGRLYRLCIHHSTHARSTVA